MDFMTRKTATMQTLIYLGAGYLICFFAAFIMKFPVEEVLVFRLAYFGGWIVLAFVCSYDKIEQAAVKFSEKCPWTAVFAGMFGYAFYWWFWLASAMSSVMSKFLAIGGVQNIDAPTESELEALGWVVGIAAAAPFVLLPAMILWGIEIIGRNKPSGEPVLPEGSWFALCGAILLVLQFCFSGLLGQAFCSVMAAWCLLTGALQALYVMARKAAGARRIMIQAAMWAIALYLLFG